MTVDGIPETLLPVAETVERSRFAASEPRPASMRSRTAAVAPEEDEGPFDDDSRENHVLDDLA